LLCFRSTVSSTLKSSPAFYRYTGCAKKYPLQCFATSSVTNRCTIFRLRKYRTFNVVFI